MSNYQLPESLWSQAGYRPMSIAMIMVLFACTEHGQYVTVTVSDGFVLQSPFTPNKVCLKMTLRYRCHYDTKQAISAVRLHNIVVFIVLTTPQTQEPNWACMHTVRYVFTENRVRLMNTTRNHYECNHYVAVFACVYLSIWSNTRLVWSSNNIIVILLCYYNTILIMIQ